MPELPEVEVTRRSFADRIADELGWAAEAPAALSHVDL